jgi:hypothetical protein
MAVEAAPSILCMADAVLGIPETPKRFMVNKLKENMHKILETMYYACTHTDIYIYICRTKKTYICGGFLLCPAIFSQGMNGVERSGTEWDGLYSGLVPILSVVSKKW